ncbi:4602_t:CDS:1, partial [Gigaspora rosea]
MSDNNEFDITDINSFKTFINGIFNEDQIITDQTPIPVDSGQDLIDQLYSKIYKLFNEGGDIPNIINNFLRAHNKSAQDILDWLLSHQNESKYTCILGLFYFYEIGTKRAKENVYNLFSNAAETDNIAKIFVAKCYEKGLNVSRDKNKAIVWYIKASECAAAEYFVGSYYFEQQKYRDAFEWLENSAKKGHAMALHTLGVCHQKALGTKVNNVEGFNSFYKAAKRGIPKSQYELAKCYEFGNGTEKDLDKALDCYNNAKNSRYDCHNDIQR